MVKEIPRPPRPAVKKDEELTEADKKELASLHINHAGGKETHAFNRILTSCVEFWKSTEWKEKEKDKKTGTLYETRPSPNTGYKAVRFTSSIPDCTCAVMERLLLDDPENKDDPKSSNIYKYSPLLTMQFDCARLGPNVVVNKSIHKIPMILIAPRQMVMYVTRAVLLNAEQQTALGVRPKSATDDQDDLNVFIQCGIEYTGDNELTKEDKGYVRGSTFVFFLMGQEEKDGSLTLTYVTDVSSGGSIPSAMADRPNAGQYRMALLIHNLLADMAKDKKNKEGHLVKVFDNDRLFSPLL